jgi:hypothetical protein
MPPTGYDKKILIIPPFFLETLTTDLGTCVKLKKCRRRLMCSANSCVKSLLHTKMMTSAHSLIEYTGMTTITTDSNSIWLLQHKPLHATKRFYCFRNLPKLEKDGITCIRGSITAIKCFEWALTWSLLQTDYVRRQLHSTQSAYNSSIEYNAKFWNKSIIWYNVNKVSTF